jgi:hypothetical protein
MSRGGRSAHYFVLWVPVPQPRICGLVEQGGGGRLEIGTATLGILAAATLGLAGTASAAPLEDGSAADAINQLRAQPGANDNGMVARANRRDITCSST